MIPSPNRDAPFIVTPHPQDIPASVLLSVNGKGLTPGHAKDFDYYHGVGVGGQVSLDGQGGDGGPGAAVIVSRVPGVPLPSRSSFFFTGKRTPPENVWSAGARSRRYTEHKSPFGIGFCSALGRSTDDREGNSITFRMVVSEWVE